jgi:trehalose utilization protein
MAIRVVVWGENRHEKKNPKVAEIYPRGMHAAIAEALGKCEGIEVTTATLDDPENGLTEDKLKNTDVLIWWGHLAHGDVTDLTVERVYARVLAGMGIVVLHSGHFSKIFRKLMGTTCNLKWREAADKEIVWVTRPGHPIAAGIDDFFVLPGEEMYGEYFDIPEPMETIFISSFSGGEVFRSGLTYTRGAGRIFYFRPGHETYPTYYDKNVLRIIENGVRWVTPAKDSVAHEFGNRKEGWMEEKLKAKK